MISTGRFVDREKHFSLLFDVMAGVAGEIPRPLLVIAGDGPDRPAYERRIRDLGLGASVLLEPWRDDLPAFLKSFDLFLLPSNYEGWGRACIEAAAAGLPIIMTDVGLAGDVLVDGVSARVVPVGDDRAMARAVVELARDPDERRRLARAAKEAVRAALYPSMADYHRAYLAAIEACRVSR
jgi:glycosyltransferase involved in cell wall biosynthesis